MVLRRWGKIFHRAGIDGPWLRGRRPGVDLADSCANLTGDSMQDVTGDAIVAKAVDIDNFAAFSGSADAARTQPYDMHKRWQPPG